MSENTKIEWATHTFNPWIGCSQIGPGCDHCYAKAAFEDRRHRAVWGTGQPRSRTSNANWRQPLRWNRAAQIEQSAWEQGVRLHRGNEAACIACGFIKPRRPKVFCASLADVFDNDVPQPWRNDLFRLIAQTPHLDWLLLTKRIGNANLMIGDALLQEPRLMSGACRAVSWPWPNVWIGATICNQEEADRDIAKLLALPAAKRFLSMEPLLGPVDLLDPPNDIGEPRYSYLDPELDSRIDWVIVGGESGAKARPMHPDWARSLRDQCQAAGVPFFMKQMGGVRDKRGVLEDLPEDLRIREFP